MVVVVFQLFIFNEGGLLLYIYIKFIGPQEHRPEFEYLGRSLGSGATLRVTPNMIRILERQLPTTTNSLHHDADLLHYSRDTSGRKEKRSFTRDSCNTFKKLQQQYGSKNNKNNNASIINNNNNNSIKQRRYGSKNRNGNLLKMSLCKRNDTIKNIFEGRDRSSNSVQSSSVVKQQIKRSHSPDSSLLSGNTVLQRFNKTNKQRTQGKLPPSEDDQHYFMDESSDSYSSHNPSKDTSRRNASPHVNVGLVCYAKNSEGYSVQPCLFVLQLVGRFCL